MPIQAPQWTEFLTCPVCCNEFDGGQRSPISLACAHTICRTCLANLHKKQCPFDQAVIRTDVNGLPVNGALLQLLVSPLPPLEEVPPCLRSLPQEQIDAYKRAKKAVEELALYLKPFSSGTGGNGAVSRPMQRKLVTLVNCQLAEVEGRCRAMRAARSLGDRTVTELILHHQNPQHLSANLWAAVRARGCQFLGPAMQEEVLKLVLLALEDGTALSRKVLVMFVVQRLEPHFPQASKTSIGHVVQLLYRASCFKVSKREGDSSLMQLKEEFRGYDALRREHDAQIVQIATEAGLRIAPDQWSALLYGDTTHKSHMQSIMDKLQNPQSFAQSVQELVIALQRTPDPGNLSNLRPHLELLAGIDPNPEGVSYSMSDLASGLEACRTVVAGLVEFMRVHGGYKGGAGVSSLALVEHSKYKISLCRDLTLKGSCPRGSTCTFAHSDDELDKFRAKNRKPPNRNTAMKEEEVYHTEDLYAEGNADYSMYPLIAQNPSYLSNRHSFPHHSNSYSPEVYGSPTHRVLVNSETPSFPEFSNASVIQHESSRGFQKLPGWRPSNPSNTKRVASNLAALHYRKQEILSKLEKVVAKYNNNPVRNDYPACTSSNYSVWNAGNAAQSTVVDPPLNNIQSTSRPVFYRTHSLVSEEEFIPFDPPVVSKYGPISRDGKKVTNPPTYDNSPSAHSLPVPPWVCSNPPVYPSHIVSGAREGFVVTSNVVDSQAVQQRPNSMPPLDNVPKEFSGDTQKVKHLKTLEKSLNDLQLGSEGSAAFTEGEKLTQELQMIELGIREGEKQLRLNQMSGGPGVNWNGDPWSGYRPEEEDTYEAGIANDIRELELRWEYELEEQEKRWSSKEETTKK